MDRGADAGDLAGPPSGRLAAVAEAVPEAVVGADLDGSILAWSSGAEELFGYSRDEAIGERLSRIVPDDRRCEQAELLQSVERGQVVRGFETVRLHRDGHPLEVCLSLGPLPPTGNPPSGLAAVYRDIEDRRRSEARLRDTERMEAVGLLAGGVAHTLNNLLTVVTGYATLAEGRLDPSHPAREDLEAIRGAGRRATELTRRLLAFGRRQLLRAESLELGSLVRETLDDLVEDGAPPDLRVEEDVTVRADGRWIRRILADLVGFAADADDGRPVEIEVARRDLDEGPAADRDLTPGEYAILSVRDRGPSLEPARLGRIFEPFYGPKVLGRGEGLGLAPAYGIARQSGGTATARTHSDGGTVVAIWLPAAEKGAGVREESSSPPDEGRSAREPGRRVLLVDDEDGVRSLARSVLEERGWEVLEASGGREALELFARCADSVDLLLTDVVMPGLGGLELASEIRSREPDLPVLLMSGYPEDVLPKEVPDADFLAKPFGPEKLERSIAGLLVTD